MLKKNTLTIFLLGGGANHEMRAHFLVPLRWSNYVITIQLRTYINMENKYAR